MAEPARNPRKAAKRGTLPRIAPPVPALSLIAEFKAAAAELGIELMPWQEHAGRYATAIRDRKTKAWRYLEVCIVVARQNGKTTLLEPLILMLLRMGYRILHTAQNRTLPRETFLDIAAALSDDEGVRNIRQANGQETIEMFNGGSYSLVAPRPGVRGASRDIVIIDEVREQHNFELMQAIRPTTTASRNPLFIYLSNAGDVTSVVLNDMKRRADEDDRLAYLEWSAAPDRAMDDLLGWQEANPALGITIQVETLRDFYRSAKPTAFETEHLCRWVRTMRPALVGEPAWERARVDDLDDPVRPFMAVATARGRASVALAWQQPDGLVALDIVEDITDDLDIDRLGEALHERAVKMGVQAVGFAPWTDATIARYFDKKAKAVDGREFANASVRFAQLVESGLLRWHGSDTISNDLLWLHRKAHESGAWQAVVIDEEHSATTALAAIRAVWLASAPKPSPPRIG